jgi:hypothetical protein
MPARKPDGEGNRQRREEKSLSHTPQITVQQGNQRAYQKKKGNGQPPNRPAARPPGVASH